MAETTTASTAAPAAATADKRKPEKPNAELFNERLAKAEKEYQDAMAKYVRRMCFCSLCRALHVIDGG